MKYCPNCGKLIKNKYALCYACQKSQEIFIKMEKRSEHFPMKDSFDFDSDYFEKWQQDRQEKLEQREELKRYFGK